MLHLETLRKKTWKNLRDKKSKCLKNRELQTLSGAEATSLEKCKLFYQIPSLPDTLANRKTKSNLEAANISRSPTNPSPPFQSSFDNETPPPSKKSKNSPINSANKVEVALFDHIQREPTADAKCLVSLSPQLESLSQKPNRKAKIEIQQVLYKYEFKKESDTSHK